MSKMIQGIGVLETVTAILENQRQILRDEPAKLPLSAGTGRGSWISCRKEIYLLPYDHKTTCFRKKPGEYCDWNGIRKG